MHVNLNINEYEHIHASWKISAGENIYTDFFENNHPFFYMFLSPFISISGGTIKTIFLMKVLMYIIYLLILFFIFKIGLLISDLESALFSILFLSITPVFAERMLEIGPEAFMMFCLIISIYFLLHYFKSKILKLRFLLISALFLSLSFLTLQKAIFLVVSLLLILVYKLLAKKISFLHFAIFYTVFLLPLVIFYVYILSSHTYIPYIIQCWKINLLYDHHFLLTDLIQKLINQLGSPIIIFYTFFYVFGLLFYLENEDQKIVGFLSLVLILTIQNSLTLNRHYYSVLIPLIAIISSIAFTKYFKNYLLKVILVIFVVFYPVINLADTWKTRPLINDLKRIKYTLSAVDPSQSVYDGYGFRKKSFFNLFRKDINFLWFSSSAQNIEISSYEKLTNYYYDTLSSIKEKKPELIRNYRLDLNSSFLKSHYIHSLTLYKDYYIINLKYLISKIVFSYWLKSSKEELIPLISSINPGLLDFLETAKIAKSFLSIEDYKRAARWYELALSKNPICKECLKKLLILYKMLGSFNKVDKIKKTLQSVGQYQINHIGFERGWSLEAINMSNKVSKSKFIDVDMYLDLLKIDLEHSAFIFFKNNGNFYFAKDFNLLKTEKTGEFYHAKGKILVPYSIPSGLYKVYFTFRLPKTNYRYRYIKNGKITADRSVLIKQIKID
jgi:tetratricopeptide (TPR) repeat protein